MIKNARKSAVPASNVQHIHTSVRPYEAYRGLAYCYRGNVCCSFCEGDYKRADGSFDVEGAQKAALYYNTEMLKRRNAARAEADFHERKALELRAQALNPFWR